MEGESGRVSGATGGHGKVTAEHVPSAAVQSVARCLIVGAGRTAHSGHCILCGVVRVMTGAPCCVGVYTHAFRTLWVRHVPSRSSAVSAWAPPPASAPLTCNAHNHAARGVTMVELEGIPVYPLPDRSVTHARGPT